jgi:hypothetical protein
MSMLREPRSHPSTDSESSGAAILTEFSRMKVPSLAPVGDPITYNEVKPQGFGNGSHTIFPGEKVMVEVN